MTKEISFRTPISWMPALLECLWILLHPIGQEQGGVMMDDYDELQ